MHRCLSFVLLFVATLTAQAPARPGTCLLAGGGKLPPVVFARFLALAGGAGARVVLIPTASETADDAKENADTLRLYRERLPGAEVTLLHTRDRAVADDEAFCTPLARATGVWLTGGAQDRLASAYLGTRVERELMALLARGGVVGGTSAGTAIQTRVMIQEGMDPPILATGFDFVPGAISDQHFLERQRLPRLLRALAMQPGRFGLGVDEGTAAVVRGDALEVVGASKVVLVLAGGTGHGAIVDEHAAGDRVDLTPWRRAARGRAAWHLGTAAGGVAAGTLVLGNSPAALARFVTLAGGESAKFLTIGTATEGQELDPKLPLIEAGARHVHGIRLDGAAPPGDTDLDGAFAGVTGVWLQDGDLETSCRMSARLDLQVLRTRLAQLLAQGGVVGGGALLGEVVFDPSINVTAGVWYERGLALLPGHAVLLDRGAAWRPAERPRWQRGLEQMPALAGIRLPTATRAAAIVHGDAIEVLGADLDLFPAPGDPNTAAARAPLRLEAGARYDLLTGTRR